MITELGCGCAKGAYRGEILATPANKVVLLDITGPYGREFTELLSVELTHACHGHTTIIRGADIPILKESGVEYRPDSIIRDLGAPVYITGRITRSEQVYSTDYYVMGTFEIIDSTKESLIGGIPDARHFAHRDYGIRRDGPLQPSDAQKVHIALARHVARELSRGLGY